jgi:hypothetical protein
MDVAAKRNPVNQHMARLLNQMDLQRCLLVDLLKPVKNKVHQKVEGDGQVFRKCITRYIPV